MKKLVLDLSTWNPAADWKKLRAAGVEGVMLRAGFGRSEGQRDNMFEAHYKAAKAAGMPVGAYHYSYAKTAAQAEAEADYFLSLIKGKRFEYPVAFDIEDNSQAGLGRRVITDMAVAFCAKVEAAGYYTMVYANLNWLETKLDYERVKRWDIWVAQYYKECRFKKPYGMWQFTSNGTVDGISGRVDQNWCYKDYPAIIQAAGLNGFGAAAPAPAPQPERRPPEEVRVGDTVTFVNGAVYASSDAVKLASNIISGPYTCKVTYTSPGAKHPYHLEGGKVAGWVDASSIHPTASTQAAPLQKGDRVRVKQGAKTYTGGSIAGFVFQNTYTVDELKGDRAVLDLKGICTPVKAGDLIRV